MYRVVFAALALQVHTLRFTETGGPGYVKHLYTYGAPKVSSPALTNPLTKDGCFPGWRFVNKNNKWYELADNVDLVPTLLGQVSGYDHVLMPTQFIDQKGKPTIHSCGWSGSQINWPNINLHSREEYVERSKPNSDSAVVNAAVIGLDNSYDADVDDVAAEIGEYGWNLVSAVKTGLTKEVVHLMQNPRTRACILTFKGSDTIRDFINDVVIVTESFCGLKEKVHKGFTLEIMKTVKDNAYQTNVRPLLGQCSELEVLGHSLGGAVASLFTACLHSRVPSGSEGYEDYKWISFDRVTTRRALPSMSQVSAANFTKMKR